MRILVSGFQPFLDERINPTEAIVNYVNSCDSHHARWCGPNSKLDVRGVVLPVLFDRAFQRLEQERSAFNPDVILSFGLAGGRETFDIEQVALNFRGSDTGSSEARTDNDGVLGRGKIDAGAPMVLPTTLPSDEILRALQAAGIPARKSFSAGTYVCNDLFFQMQNRLRFTRVQSGFIHVPRLVAPEEEAAQKFDAKALQTAWLWNQFQLAVDSLLDALC